MPKRKYRGFADLGLLPGTFRGKSNRGDPGPLLVPRAHRRKIRSTNGLERFSQEIRRRTTRVVRIFPNREVGRRLVTALWVEQSEEWLSGKRCLDMSPTPRRP